MTSWMLGRRGTTRAPESLGDGRGLCDTDWMGTDAVNGNCYMICECGFWKWRLSGRLFFSRSVAGEGRRKTEVGGYCGRDGGPMRDFRMFVG